MHRQESKIKEVSGIASPHGDIFVTRWIWKRSIEIKANKWVTRISVFFGVMLMPLGLAIFTLCNLNNGNNKTGQKTTLYQQKI